MMTKAGDRYVVSGSLNMETVPTLFNQGLAQLAQGNLMVDFSSVGMVDSATVSMLLGWKRAAKRQQRQLSVVGLPDNLISLATLYGVADLLPTS